MTIQLKNNSTTLELNERLYTDLVEGEFLSLTPVNAKTFRVNDSKDVTVGNRADGGVHDLVIRVVKNSADDIVLNNAINQSTPVVFNGSMKELMVKDGSDFTSTWDLVGGTLTTRPTDARNNQDGNAVMEYTIQFRDAVRLV
jgi:hypothetical protein